MRKFDLLGKDAVGKAFMESILLCHETVLLSVFDFQLNPEGLGFIIIYVVDLASFLLSETRLLWEDFR